MKLTDDEKKLLHKINSKFEAPLFSLYCVIFSFFAGEFFALGSYLLMGLDLLLAGVFGFMLYLRWYALEHSKQTRENEEAHK